MRVQTLISRLETLLDLDFSYISELRKGYNIVKNLYKVEKFQIPNSLSITIFKYLDDHNSQNTYITYSPESQISLHVNDELKTIWFEFVERDQIFMSCIESVDFDDLDDLVELNQMLSMMVLGKESKYVIDDVLENRASFNDEISQNMRMYCNTLNHLMNEFDVDHLEL